MRHFVSFFFPSGITGEYTVKEFEVSQRIPQIIRLLHFPKNSFAYRFFDRQGDALGIKSNLSEITYFGKKYTLEEVQRLPECSISVKEMLNNDWKAVVQTAFGWFPLEANDKVS